MSKKALLITSIAVVVLAALIVSFIVFLTPNDKNKVSSSTTGAMVENVTTINGVAPASIAVAPATQKWWDTFLKYNSDATLDSLSFDSVSKNSVYVAYTLSPGEQYDDYDSLGLPTTFIIYETSEDARQGGIALGNTHSHFVRGNMLLLIPEGAYTDVDYSLEQYVNSQEKIDESDLALNDKAILQINFKSLQTILMDGAQEVDKNVYETTLALLGITEESNWVGYSSDGLTWDGKFNDVDVTSLNDPTAIISYLSEQLYFLSVDGETLPISQATEENQSGVMYPRQSRASEFFGLSNNSEAAGSYTRDGDDLSTPVEKLAADDGIYRIDINPNAWIGIMRAEETLYPVTEFSTLSITVTDADGSSTLVLTPID